MAAHYYQDARTLVMDQTLLRYQCIGESVRVPSSFGGRPVTTVGGGALTLDGVKELSFDPGYIELKEKCLGYSTSLQRIRVPETVQTIAEALEVRRFYALKLDLFIDRALPPAAFLDIKSMSLPMEGGKRLLTPAALKRAELAPVRSLMNLSASPPTVICRDMRILFHGMADDSISGLYTGTVFDPRPCYDFLSGRQATEEYTAVMEMIRADDPGWHDPAAEKTNDLTIRTGKLPVSPATCSQVAIAVCQQTPAAPETDGLFHLTVHMYREHLFFPALRHLFHRGSDWWVYSRNYLSSSPSCPYLRDDVGVFTRDGLVTDRKTSEDVYAKYRFLTIL